MATRRPKIRGSSLQDFSQDNIFNAEPAVLVH